MCRYASRKHNGIDVARKAAIRIQANWRVKMARKEFLKSKTSAVLIQSGFRGARARGELAMQVCTSAQLMCCCLCDVIMLMCVFTCMITACSSADVSVCMAASASVPGVQESEAVSHSDSGDVM